MKFHFDLLAPIYDYLIPPIKPREILSNIVLDPSFKVLEVGGGTGRLASFLSKHVGEVYSLEPSLPMLYKSSKSNHFVKHVHGYAEEQPFPNEFFDLVFSVDSLHHWDDQERGLQEIHRVLKPGGELFIAEIHPNTRSGHFIVSMEKAFLMKSCFFTPTQLRELLLQCGFIIKKLGWLEKPTYFVLAKK